MTEQPFQKPWGPCVILRKPKPEKAECIHYPRVEPEPGMRAYCYECCVWHRVAFWESANGGCGYAWRVCGPVRARWYQFCGAAGLFGYLPR